jgi:hypothetical protein
MGESNDAATAGGDFGYELLYNNDGGDDDYDEESTTTTMDDCCCCESCGGWDGVAMHAWAGMNEWVESGF